MRIREQGAMSGTARHPVTENENEGEGEARFSKQLPFILSLPPLPPPLPLSTYFFSFLILGLPTLATGFDLRSYPQWAEVFQSLPSHSCKKKLDWLNSMEPSQASQWSLGTGIHL